MNPEDVLGIVIKKIRHSSASEEQISNAVDDYYKRNPLKTDTTLSVPGGIADAETVGDELKTKAVGEGITLFFDSKKQCMAAKVESR